MSECCIHAQKKNHGIFHLPKCVNLAAEVSNIFSFENEQTAIIRNLKRSLGIWSTEADRYAYCILLDAKTRRRKCRRTHPHRSRTCIGRRWHCTPCSPQALPTIPAGTRPSAAVDSPRCSRPETPSPVRPSSHSPQPPPSRRWCFTLGRAAPQPMPLGTFWGSWSAAWIWSSPVEAAHFLNGSRMRCHHHRRRRPCGWSCGGRGKGLPAAAWARGPDGDGERIMFHRKKDNMPASGIVPWPRPRGRGAEGAGLARGWGGWYTKRWTVGCE
jgi:hypothetical protein